MLLRPDERMIRKRLGETLNSRLKFIRGTCAKSRFYRR